MLKTIVPAALASIAALTAVATPAAAQKDQVVVSHTDLDLATDAGQQRLANRLAGATREICGYDDERTSAGKRAYRQCVIDTKASFASAQQIAIADAGAERMAVATGAAAVVASR